MFYIHFEVLQNGCGRQHEICFDKKDKFYLYAIAKFVNHTRRSEDKPQEYYSPLIPENTGIWHELKGGKMTPTKQQIL